MGSRMREVQGIAPIGVGSEELASWSGVPNGRFRWVQRLVRYLPRGKGYVPRNLGRTIFRNTRGLIRMANGVYLPVVPKRLDAYVARCDHLGCVISEMCIRSLAPGQCFYDIGANIGSVSFAVANAFNDQVRICAFEPQPILARHVALAAALNDFQNISVYEALVGENDTEADLLVPQDGTQASLILAERRFERVPCRMISLDEQLLIGALPPPAVMKIDVEGAEYQVFRGAKGVIQAHTPVILFEADENLERFGATPSQLFDYLRSLADYEFYYLRSEPGREDRIIALEHAVGLPEANFLAVSANDNVMKERLLVPARGG